MTSEANERSWSTIVLMVSFSSSISPLTSTVIFFERSPVATAVVTAAMFRTWLVRLPAMELTLSVRSFQVPATPFTLAWPPSLPSLPTSRATRVTSEAKEPSCSTIVLTVRAVFRNSPCSARPSISMAMACERSPWATAVMTRELSLKGAARSPIRALTAPTESAHEPLTSPMLARWLSLPSLPTALLIRSSSCARRWLRSTTPLKASAILPPSPTQSSGRRTVKSPRPRADSALSKSRGSISVAPLPFNGRSRPLGGFGG